VHPAGPLDRKTWKLDATSFANESATWPPVTCARARMLSSTTSDENILVGQPRLLTVKELVKYPMFLSRFPVNPGHRQPLWWDGHVSVPGRGLDASPSRVLLEPIWSASQKPFDECTRASLRAARGWHLPVPAYVVEERFVG